MELMTYREQSQLSAEDLEVVKGLNLQVLTDGTYSDCLSLSTDGWTSYFVGAAWLGDSDKSLVVTPKFPNIDFLGIFSKALSNGLKPEYFDNAYSIDFKQKPIDAPVLNSILTPLLISHFVALVQSIVCHGLKRNYVLREENLRSKVKGHILFLPNFQHNILSGHANNTYCRFQEYVADYPENRLIKRALLASKAQILGLKSDSANLLFHINKLLSFFSEVSDIISLSEVKILRKNKLFGNYPEALKIAKVILQYRDFSINQSAENSHSVPVFYIDMSRIFEFCVYAYLCEHYAPQDIEFQVYGGIVGRCDFLVKPAQMIIDAKYKINYLTNTDALRTDIREVAGYARSTKFRDILGVTDERSIHCQLIYPCEQSHSQTPQSHSTPQPINDVINFTTLAIPIPLIINK